MFLDATRLLPMTSLAEEAPRWVLEQQVRFLIGCHCLLLFLSLVVVCYLLLSPVVIVVVVSLGWPRFPQSPPPPI